MQLQVESKVNIVLSIYVQIYHLKSYVLQAFFWSSRWVPPWSISCSFVWLEYDRSFNRSHSCRKCCGFETIRAGPCMFFSSCQFPPQLCWQWSYQGHWGRSSYWWTIASAKMGQDILHRYICILILNLKDEKISLLPHGNSNPKSSSLDSDTLIKWANSCCPHIYMHACVYTCIYIWNWVY